MKYKVRHDPSGLWSVIAPSGQTAGLAPTSREADAAARGLTAFLAFSTRGGAGVDTSYDGDGVKPSWGGWCQKCRRADGARRGNVKRRKREAEQKRQQARMGRTEHEKRLEDEREAVARAERNDPSLASYMARRRARLGVAA